MSKTFFSHPILNSPYDYPGKHWELDADGQPTQKIIGTRREAKFQAPIPKPKKRSKGQTDAEQQSLTFETQGLSDESQKYDLFYFINSIRAKVNAWRQIPNPSDWKVTPETVRLLQHWRHHNFQSIRPFFCQVEAVETAIWLAEVAPNGGVQDKAFLDHILSVNGEANPELLRVALKLATGAGKTTVMAMLIAWQTINAVRRPQSRRFTRGFLVVTPGITIRDRLRVLQPNDTESYYAQRELVPTSMLPDLQKAKIGITNYHAFKQRVCLQGEFTEFVQIESEFKQLNERFRQP
ncbi:DEAD/DEAH box helicase family protein [Lyngbya confervoides]|uniref:DEAD/DEAH box helicase family protein n=1 Tax=Lyngbya confervoides BDU141951 TaxID=1574623 RepID=A0ABD4T576_9CYAN|nr:DEAD/DEAH box helicase family protein [Lyngbya confervoides]MCM1983946.1 DEAD/DEAH box helicase family protein [Lyngbya confervoides BDU141951]